MVCIDLNRATAHDFTRILGIGDVVAHRIIQRRYELQGFQSFDEVLAIDGVGNWKLQALQQNFYIESQCCTLT